MRMFGKNVPVVTFVGMALVLALASPSIRSCVDDNINDDVKRQMLKQKSTLIERKETITANGVTTVKFTSEKARIVPDSLIQNFSGLLELNADQKKQLMSGQKASIYRKVEMQADGVIKTVTDTIPAHIVPDAQILKL